MSKFNDSVSDVRRLLDARLSVQYHEDGNWAISYTLESGAKIRFNDRMSPEQICAQVRGIVIAFIAPDSCVSPISEDELKRAIVNALRSKPGADHE